MDARGSDSLKNKGSDRLAGGAFFVDVLAALYLSRESGKIAASSGIGTGGPCEACFSLLGATGAGVAQPQLTGAAHELPPQFQ